MIKILSVRLGILFAILLFGSNLVCAQENEFLPFEVAYFRDSTNVLNLTDVKSKTFIDTDAKIFNFGIENNTVWLKLTAKSKQEFDKKILFIEQARFKNFELYHVKPNLSSSLLIPFDLFKDQKRSKSQGISYLLPSIVEKNETFYLKLKAHEAFVTRIFVTSEPPLISSYAIK
ncbi:MAG: hypothetical protein EOO07_35565, partial [Chitinophagaceae bacterium]